LEKQTAIAPLQTKEVGSGGSSTRDVLLEWPSIEHYKPPPEQQPENEVRRVPKVFDGPWHVEEKMDGSQLSFMLSKEDKNEVIYRNRTHFMSDKDPYHNNMFTNAILGTSALKGILNPNYIYRGEAICKQRHNVLKYSRTARYGGKSPIGYNCLLQRMYFVLFDVEDTSTKMFLSYEEKVKEGSRIGLEVSPRLFSGDGPR
jgi:hypothetical protein